MGTSMTQPETSTQDAERDPLLDVPRVLAYPLLLAVPVVCIFLGISLGRNAVGAQFMLSSQNGTPVENWVLSLIASSIALFMYGSWAYSNRTLRVQPTTAILVLTYIGAIFVFGVWGLYASIIPSAVCLLLWMRYKRGLAKSTGEGGQRE